MRKKYDEMTDEQKERARESKRRWHEKNRDKIAENKRKHYLANRDKYLLIERERSYRKLYGIGVEDYNTMFIAQGGACAICKSKTSGKKNPCFAVDHCHETGIIRGLLCTACNVRLGYLTWYEKIKSL
jgi:hypothetical protein